MQDYKTIRSVEEIDAYLGNATIVAFDFETAATEDYRDEDLSALDAHKADIAGISVSVAAGTARYIPLRHRVGQNADVETVMAYLRSRLFNSSRIVKVAHNLSFEAMFLYKYGIVIQEPVVSSTATVEQRTYTVQSGDTLWGIAKKELGSGARYTEIVKLNGLKTSTIYKGQILKLPEK